ncbi:MAG: amidase [Gemmatimonadota bacterium]
MADETRRTPGRAGPQDEWVDRRSFLERMGLLTAAAAAGCAPTPIVPGSTAPPSPLSRPADVLPRPEDVRATRPWEMTLAQLASLIREGALAPSDVVDGYLGRIDALDPVLLAFNTVTADQARSIARSLDGTEWRGPLHGIPLAIKDNYHTSGVLTTANSHIFADFVPESDATSWARLSAAGAILLGKTQMGPLATSRATTPDGEATTMNAWASHDPDVSPGGSSSGSATAVAARLAASSTGTQTGGSITNPSSRQGLTGLKPTMGRVSLHGIIPLSYTRDHAGPLARDAKDAALMLQTMAGPDPADSRTLGLPSVPDYGLAADAVRQGGRVTLRWPTTVGVPPGFLDVPEPRDPGRFRSERQVDPVAREERLRVARERNEAEVEARRTMLATFESLGARIVEVALPEDWETLTGSDFNNVRLPERAEPFLEHLRRDVRLFGVSLSPWINGLLLSGPEYLRGQRAKLLLLERVLEGIFEECDVVAQTSPIPFDIIGLPLITFPIGFERSRGFDLPVGGMLGGKPFGEERLLSLAAAYQAETDWHLRRPVDPNPRPGGSGGQPGDRAGRPRLDVLQVMEECE